MENTTKKYNKQNERMKNKNNKWIITLYMKLRLFV